MPYRTLCGFPPLQNDITLRVPNGKWRPDTVITDTDGNEVFVLMEADKSMRGYEAIFGDLEGRKLCCVRRKLFRAPNRDGYYFCTYRPSIRGQPALMEKDVNNKSIYPFAFVEVAPVKGRYWYSLYAIDKEKDEMIVEKPRLVSDNPWLGFMMICCTPFTRCGKWAIRFRKPGTRKTIVKVDQWKNMVHCHAGQDLLASLCLAYVFDKSQCQPMITVLGEMDPEYDFDDDASLDSNVSYEDNDEQQKQPLNQPQQQPNYRDSDDDESDFDDDNWEDPDKPQSSYPPAEPDAIPYSQALD